MRTAGGHYRIAQNDIERFVPSPSPARARANRGEPVSNVGAHAYCWEFLAPGRAAKDECRFCLAYQVGANWCFRLKQAIDLGSTRCCCGPENCEDCPYYRRVRGLPTRVLVVASGRDLATGLSRDQNLEVSLAHNDYEAAQMVTRLHPAIAVVDEDNRSFDAEALIRNLQQDRHAAGMRIVRAVGRRPAGRTVATARREVIHVMKKPLDGDTLLGVLPKLPSPAQRLAAPTPEGAGIRATTHPATDFEKGEERRG